MHAFAPINIFYGGVETSPLFFVTLQEFVGFL